jgi:hypothetical protein
MTLDAVVAVIIFLPLAALCVFLCLVFACAGISLMGRSQR